MVLTSIFIIIPFIIIIALHDGDVDGECDGGCRGRDDDDANGDDDDADDDGDDAAATNFHLWAPWFRMIIAA
eukprot:9124951-Karenia_brevis.AAC.1